MTNLTVEECQLYFFGSFCNNELLLTDCLLVSKTLDLLNPPCELLLLILHLQ